MEIELQETLNQREFAAESAFAVACVLLRLHPLVSLQWTLRLRSAAPLLPCGLGC